MMTSDSALQRDVSSELEWEPSVDHSDIGVSVHDGVVTLNGYVHSYAERLAAERATRRVLGVKAIAQEIKVRYAAAPKTADHQIAKRVLDIFAWSVLVPEGQIGVKVENGWVTLTGSVDWNFQIEEAEKAAGKISGVLGIMNRIDLRTRPMVGDVRKLIEEALERQAGFDAAGITIAVKGGKVKLGGSVGAWHEREVAERAAWAAPGVTTVEDHIAVS